MTASELAISLGATVRGAKDHSIARAVHPDHAGGPQDLAVALTMDLVPRLAHTKAGAALLPQGATPPDGSPAVLIEVPLSRRSLPDATAHFCFRPAIAAGVHPSAIVDEDAEIDPTACIGPFCYVAGGAVIAAGTTLVSHCAVLPGARIGPDGLLHPGVRIGSGVQLGARVVIQSNAIVGSDGFSFLPADPGNVESVKATGEVNPDPAADATLLKVHSLGGVEVGDDVEIGAQTAIDAGTLAPTRIGRGTKIDNLVQIGHNVEVGEDCLLCGRVAVAGSTVIGNRVVLAGGVGVADHLSIADDVVVAGGSGVASNLRSAGFYSGVPAAPHKESVRNYRNLKRLDRLVSKVLNPPAS